MEGAAWLSGTSWELGCRLHAAHYFRPWGLCLDFCDQSLINTRKEEKTRTGDRRHCAQPDDLQRMSAASASRRQCACHECRDNRQLDQVSIHVKKHKGIEATCPENDSVLTRRAAASPQ